MNNKMAINAYLSIIESKNKISQQAEQKQNHRYKEHFYGFWIGGGCGGIGEGMRVLRSTNQQLQNSHGDVKYSIGNTVNNILITMYGVRWVQDLSG